MCGRYNLISTSAELVDFFAIEGGAVGIGELAPRYNIAPTQWVPAARAGVEGRELVLLKWGLIPFWAKDPKIAYHTINARAETVAEKPAFREAFKLRRCLIPATGFYEWKQEGAGKQPFHIGLEGGGLFAFAGLWESWRGEEGETIQSCCIIVTAADGIIRPIHDRMPVILSQRDFSTWLDPKHRERSSLLALLSSAGRAALSYYPVSPFVNNPRNDTARCIRPLQEQAQPPLPE